ncbi:flippase [Candidatus Uhrbacteria bacterium]|nr:flippase [Candidatus Uhrbacteria bacterium]
MSTPLTQRVARNTAWFTAGSLLQKLISFVYFTIIAMVFGVSGTGKYFFALTFTTLFAIIADWGIAPTITREFAKSREAGTSLLAAATAIKCIGAGIAATMATVIAAAAGYPISTQQMIFVAIAAMVFDSVHQGLYAALRGLQRVHYEAVGVVLGQIMLTVSGVIMIWVVGDVQVISWAPIRLAARREVHPVLLLVPYILTSLTNILAGIVGWMRERIPAPRLSCTKAQLLLLLRMATPFAITAGLARLYTYSDTFLLSLLQSEEVIGYYGTPFKIAFAFQFIPLALIGALYPAMSAVAVRDRAQVGVLFEQSVRVLLLIAIPIAAGIGVLAEEIVLFVYGPAFLPSVVPLIVLIAALPCIFANFPAGYLLNACDRQSWNTGLIAAATVLNVAANLLLIPSFGATGAAIAATGSSVVLFIMNLVVLRRAVHYRIATIVDAAIRIGAAATCMIAAILLLPIGTLPVRIVIGALVYSAGLFVTRGVRMTDLRTLRNAFQRHPGALPTTSASVPT